jgi:cytochrome P450
MAPDTRALPVADGETGLRVLKGLLRERSLLAALQLMRVHVGRAFQITLPGFRPVVFTSAEANRQILVSERLKLSWRPKNDPVAALLRRGILVVDGAEHDELRARMEPLLQRRKVTSHIPSFWQQTDRVTAAWADGESCDLLVEMRKVALLIFFDTLFAVDFNPHIDRLWQPILALIEYISPGPWIIFPKFLRESGLAGRKYRPAQEAVDGYLYSLIAERRARLSNENLSGDRTTDDLLSRLVLDPYMSDDLIRDQLLTMLIAGHDTSTASLAWTLYLLGCHPQVMASLRQEVDAVLGEQEASPDTEQVNQLVLLDQVVKEALRLYPPIHLGNRLASEDLQINGYHIPKDTRLMYSIYLCQRDESIWKDAESFCPERFTHGSESVHPPFSYLPFGGGPRNCIGAAFAQVEVKVVLARLLQNYDFRLLNAHQIKPHMGATLEPRPGVLMQVTRRRRENATQD